MRGLLRVRRNLQAREVVSKSPEETQKLGLELARALSIPGVVLLRGALGTGKTTLTRGIAQGLGLDDPSLVNSPSFTLVNIYHGRCPIYHVDLYRLKGERDLYSIGLEEFFGKEGVTVVEWSERLSFPAEQAIAVEIVDAGNDLRVLHISPAGLTQHCFLNSEKVRSPDRLPKTRMQFRRRRHRI